MTGPDEQDARPGPGDACPHADRPGGSRADGSRPGAVPPLPDGLPEELGGPDIPQLVELEKLCFAVPWSARQYRTVLGHEPFRVFGLRLGTELIAYVTLYSAAFEMEILNIAVHPDWRRRGLGRRLLTHVLLLCRKMGIQRGYLEVRRSNVPAQGLYRAFGFEEVGVRKGYYPDNREDALILRLEFEAGGSG